MKFPDRVSKKLAVMTGLAGLSGTDLLSAPPAMINLAIVYIIIQGIIDAVTAWRSSS